jgi:hypothetical protein
MSEDELAALLIQSRGNNKELNLTGMLLYAQGTFLQALEGDETAVNKIFGSINKDKRHKNVVKIITGELTERAFPDWSMGFLAVSPEKMAELDGYINPLQNHLLAGNSDNTVISILKTFAETNNFTI